MSRSITMVLCILLLLAGGVNAQEETQEPDAGGQPTTYIVQPGDNLYRIALRFGTTTSALAAANNITNASQIFSGQELIIPDTATNADAAVDTETPSAQEPTATPAPVTSSETYIVQRGDSLNKIALRYNITVADLIAANQLANPNIIFAGQELLIPGTTPSQPAATEPEAVATADTPPAMLEDAGFGYGIEVFFDGQDTAELTQLVEQLGVGWVKIRVEWRQLEPVQGQIDFTQLDTIVSSLDSIGVNILFTVVNAPTWSRTSQDENGPPDDLATFTTFMAALTDQYGGTVDAYEIWDEPNLRRNWNCTRRMCDTDYLDLLRIGYDAVKAADAEAWVITAGLAPTRFNDRINAIDDRLYLTTLYANGVADISDAIGIHPGGWANPPDAECCEATDDITTHYENDVFYFKDNLEAYRTIMTNNSDAAAPLWITKFGWGTSEDTDPPGELNIFITYTTLAEQALYIPRAYELGQELGYIGPMFLDNLNGCQGLPSRIEVCYTALLAPDGTPRLAFEAVQNIEKPADMTNGTDTSQAEEVMEEATEEPETPASPIEPIPVEPAVEMTEEPADEG